MARTLSREELIDIFVKVAKATNSRPSEVEEVYESIWICLKRAVSKVNCPNVVLPNFGRFYVNQDTIRAKILRSIGLYRAGRMTKEGLAKIFSINWPVYKSIQERKIRKLKEKKNGRSEV